MKNTGTKSLLSACSVAAAFLPFSALRAIEGIGDTVIITQDWTYGTKWKNERAEWEKVIAQLRVLNEKNEDLLKRLGSSSSSGPSASGSVASVTDPTGAALALETRAKAQQRGKKENSLRERPKTTLQPGMKVEASMDLFGSKQTRDESRYEVFAIREALWQRHAQALENQNTVLQKEFTEQKRLLEKLRSAKTDADIQAVQAALAASQQRLDLAREKSTQARDECRILDAELELERSRKQEGDREWEEGFVEKLRARALISLHAQKGENS
jgi:hypothetical protein